MRKVLILSLIILFFSTNIVFALDPSYRFTDQEKDFESGLYNFDARQYSPSAGQFIQPDPVLNNLANPQKLKQQTGQNLEQFLSNPQNLNPYSYTRNNPVIYIDPTGEFQIHFNNDMTEEQKQQFLEALTNLQNTVKDNQEVIDYFNKFDVDIVTVLEDNNQGPDVFFKKEMKDSEGNDLYGAYNSLTNNVLINFETIIDGVQAVASTLIHELGHWANDVADWWFDLNPNVDEYGLTDYIKNYMKANFVDGEKYFKRDKIYGFLAEMLTFSFIF
ncbi:RHS repeat-associated core domain-containing protein [Patescibacteria group bacterium]|nr:RHS repeat-associated core domain-containing protein [Patescibacteria group bacterium]